MTFLFFLSVIIFLIYSFIGAIYFSCMDVKRQLTKQEQEVLLNKIKTSNVMFTDGGDGQICTGTRTYWDIEFEWSPFPMQYYFKKLGWVSWFSPVAKELSKRRKQYKEEQFKSTLQKYGLVEE